MITKTSLAHPRVTKRIKHAVWLAKMQSIKTHKRSTEYVRNKKGNNVLRIDVLETGELVCYASNGGMKNYGPMIVKLLEGY